MNAQELKEAREKSGMSQQQLAEKAGWIGKNAKQRVYDYESGRRNMPPAVQTLFKMIFSG